MRKRPLLALLAGPCLTCSGLKPSWISHRHLHSYHHHHHHLPWHHHRHGGTAAPESRPRHRLFSSSSPQGSIPTPTPATIGTALSWAITAFKAKGVPEAEKSAEYLLLHAFTLSSPLPPSTPAWPLRLPRSTQPVDAVTMDYFHQLCERRLRREPVQYIVGTWDFHLITLEMRPPMLIPRPETEELVELVLQRVVEERGKQAPVRFVDVGAGTGAIGLALLAALPQAHCVAVDINPLAVELARHNAKTLGLEGRYECLHVGVDRLNEVVEAKSLDLIVSNPPYIPEADMAGLEPEVKDYEDRGALCGGADGGDVIRAILRVAPALLSPQGLGEVWMEVDVSHPERVEGQGWLPPQLRLAQWYRDMGGRPRFCHFIVVEEALGC